MKWGSYRTNDIFNNPIERTLRQFRFSVRIRNAPIWYDIEQLQWNALTIYGWEFYDERWKNDNRILQRKWNFLWRYCGTFHVRLCHWSVTFYVLSYPILSRSLITRENFLNAVLAYALYVRGKFTRRQSIPPTHFQESSINGTTLDHQVETMRCVSSSPRIAILRFRFRNWATLTEHKCECSRH